MLPKVIKNIASVRTENVTTLPVDQQYILIWKTLPDGRQRQLRRLSKSPRNLQRLGDKRIDHQIHLWDGNGETGKMNPAMPNINSRRYNRYGRRINREKARVAL